LQYFYWCILAPVIFLPKPQAEPITRQETLRGSVTPEREWWDVLHLPLAGGVLTGNEKRMFGAANTDHNDERDQNGDEADHESEVFRELGLRRS